MICSVLSNFETNDLKVLFSFYKSVFGHLSHPGLHKVAHIAHMCAYTELFQRTQSFPSVQRRKEGRIKKERIFFTFFHVQCLRNCSHGTNSFEFIFVSNLISDKQKSD